MILTGIPSELSFWLRLKPSIFTVAARPFGSSNFPSLHAKSRIPFDYIRKKKPPGYMISGDNEPLIYETYDLSKPTVGFQNCRNFENAGEIVQKLVSLRYASRREKHAYVRQEFMNLVRRHPLDTQSLEARIAKYTVFIRHHQQDPVRLKKDGRLAAMLTCTVDRRKKLLKFLRKADMNRFNWILESLNITYTPPPLFYHWTTRKGTLRNLTRQHCEKLHKQKIDEYRAKLKSLQAEFLEEKEKTLEWIKKEEEELQLTPEEVAFMKQQMQPFKIPVFPKLLSFKAPIVPFIKIVPEQ